MWALGVDIGKTVDPTALAAIEAAGEGEDGPLDLRHLERVPLGTAYPAVVDRVGKVVDHVPEPRELVVDATGVGRPVLDMLEDAGRCPIGVVITGGASVCHEDGTWLWSVPKALLVRPVVTALETGRLRIARGLGLVDAFKAELQAFKVSFSERGHASFNGDGEHDDLVLAVALALWRIEAGEGERRWSPQLPSGGRS